MCFGYSRKFYNRIGATKEDVKDIIDFFEKEGKDWTSLVAFYMEMIITGPDPNDTP